MRKILMTPFGLSHYLCRRIQTLKKMTDITFIIIGALATAFLLLVVLLILGLLYYRWRLSDSQHMLVRFIRENFRLREKLNENDIY